MDSLSTIKLMPFTQYAGVMSHIDGSHPDWEELRNFQNSKDVEEFCQACEDDITPLLLETDAFIHYLPAFIHCTIQCAQVELGSLKVLSILSHLTPDNRVSSQHEDRLREQFAHITEDTKMAVNLFLQEEQSLYPDDDYAELASYANSTLWNPKLG